MTVAAARRCPVCGYWYGEWPYEHPSHDTPKSCQAPIQSFRLPATTQNADPRKAVFSQVSPQVSKTEKRKMGSEQRNYRCEEGTKWQRDTYHRQAASTGHASSPAPTETAPRPVAWRSCRVATAANQSATSTASTKTTPRASRPGRGCVTPSALSAPNASTGTGSRTTSRITPGASEKARSLGRSQDREAARPGSCLLTGRGGPFRVAAWVKFHPTTPSHSRAAGNTETNHLEDGCYWPAGDAT